MSTLWKTLALVGMALIAVGCAGTQQNTEVAAHGTARTDAAHEKSPETPTKGHEFWQKMR